MHTPFALKILHTQSVVKRNLCTGFGASKAPIKLDKPSAL